MTQWTGHAWTELASKPELIQKLFEKIGCLVTSDGSQRQNQATRTEFIFVLGNGL